jgi:hypothetical protein
MKKILLVMLFCNFGCAGLNHDMLANALNNADEQLKKECECECKKTKKKNQRINMAKYEIFDDKNQ